MHGQLCARRGRRRPEGTRDVDAQPLGDDDVLAEEGAHLSSTLRRLGRVLADAEASLGRREADYREVKRYMVENRAELDPAEMFQNEVLLRDADSHGQHAMRCRDRLAALRSSPYFGRVDFRAGPHGVTRTGRTTSDADPSSEVQVACIGRHSFRDDQGIAVLDWRSPFAGMFYDGDRGPAGYGSPAEGRRGAARARRDAQGQDHHGAPQAGAR